jgi:hypothetical protein
MIKKIGIGATRKTGVSTTEIVQFICGLFA